MVHISYLRHEVITKIREEITEEGRIEDEGLRKHKPRI